VVPGARSRTHRDRLRLRGACPWSTAAAVDLGLLADVEQRRADQVADILDEQQGSGLGVQSVDGPLHHRGVQVTARPDVHLDRAGSRAPDPLGVERGLLVTLDDADRAFRSQLGDGPLQQRGLAGNMMLVPGQMIMRVFVCSVVVQGQHPDLPVLTAAAGQAHGSATRSTDATSSSRRPAIRSTTMSTTLWVIPSSCISPGSACRLVGISER